MGGNSLEALLAFGHVLSTFLCGGILFGWSAMNALLEEDGVFKLEGESKRIENLAFIFTVSCGTVRGGAVVVILTLSHFSSLSRFSRYRF